jgi:hypothetical protein
MRVQTVIALVAAVGGCNAPATRVRRRDQLSIPGGHLWTASYDQNTISHMGVPPTPMDCPARSSGEKFSMTCLIRTRRTQGRACIHRG